MAQPNPSGYRSLLAFWMGGAAAPAQGGPTQMALFEQVQVAQPWLEQVV
jgi:hypothetical protein